MSLPRSLIRIINGFSSNKGDYWLARSNICPPESLQRKVLPQADEWLERVWSRSYECSICAEALLSLLITMRRIILQDAVMFRVDYLETHSSTMFSSTIQNYWHSKRTSCLLYKPQKNQPITKYAGLYLWLVITCKCWVQRWTQISVYSPALSAITAMAQLTLLWESKMTSLDLDKTCKCWGRHPHCLLMEPK